MRASDLRLTQIPAASAARGIGRFDPAAGLTSPRRAVRNLLELPGDTGKASPSPPAGARDGEVKAGLALREPTSWATATVKEVLCLINQVANIAFRYHWSIG
jgi:hypothetical protein